MFVQKLEIEEYDKAWFRWNGFVNSLTVLDVA